MATENEAEEQNPLALSDDDFLNMMSGGAATEQAAAADEVVEGAAAADVVENAPAEGAAAEEQKATADTPGEGETPDDKDAKADPDPAAADTTGSAAGDTGAKETPKTEGVSEETPPNYEALYKELMAPLKANGKVIDLKSPQELVQLAQMGANYTRKMQELVPHRKVLAMLQNNDLLDEDKLSYLIDLDKKNPEAIKKLLKESGIDPLEIDTSADTTYHEGNHRVSDAEVNFSAALEELSSTPEGKGTISVINTRWDKASKDALFEKPETMAIIHTQREAGIYDRIVAEVDRQTTLGTIPAGTPFLQAYSAVGDQLHKAGAFADLQEKQQGTSTTDNPDPPGQVDTKVEPAPVATRAATPKPLANDDAASAASATKSTPKQTKEFVNVLAMSDDDFLKQFSGRL